MNHKDLSCPEHGCKCSSAYTSKKCRCSACKEWRKLYSQRPQFKASNNKWKATEAGKKSLSASQSKYTASSKGKARSNRSNHNRRTRLAGAYQLTHKGLKALTEAIMSLNVPGHDLEHRLPVAKGGGNSPWNLCYLESSVNRAKGATHFDDYDIPADAVIDWRDLIPNWKQFLAL